MKLDMPGLKHPSGDVPDNTRYTVEAYNTGGLKKKPWMLQLFDVSALQHLYGAAASRNASDDVYSFGSTDAMVSIWDTGGRDTLSAAGATDGAIINLNATSFSSIGFSQQGFSLENPARNISIAKGADIENAIGSSHGDVLIGNRFGNNLDGGSGRDFIFGDEVVARTILPDPARRDVLWRDTGGPEVPNGRIDFGER